MVNPSLLWQIHVNPAPGTSSATSRPARSNQKRRQRHRGFPSSSSNLASNVLSVPTGLRSVLYELEADQDGSVLGELEANQRQQGPVFIPLLLQDKLSQSLSGEMLLPRMPRENLLERCHNPRPRRHHRPLERPHRPQGHQKCPEPVSHSEQQQRRAGGARLSGVSPERHRDDIRGSY